MSKYAETGVDVSKKGINVFKSSVESLFPGSFCTISYDPDFAEYGQIHHADGTGSGTVVRYIMHKEGMTDESIFAGDAINTVAMNTGDLVCVGGYPISLVDYVAVNGFYVNKQNVLAALNDGFKRSIDYLRENGCGKLGFHGGETADLPYQTKTLDVSGAVYGRVKLSNVITGNKIQPGNIIVGVRSGGPSRFEIGENPGIVTPGKNYENSAMMSNGLTLAWHCLLDKLYNKKYPETTEKKGKPFYGRYKVDDRLDVLDITVGEALSYPTRLFAPIGARVLEKHGYDVTSMVHNTGGGQTKCLRMGHNFIYVKDNLPEPDPIFKLIQRESGASWKEMYQDYNMGTGFDITVTNQRVAEEVISTIENDFGVGAQIVGCVGGIVGAKNELVIDGKFGRFHYKQD